MDRVTKRTHQRSLSSLFLVHALVGSLVGCGLGLSPRDPEVVDVATEPKDQPPVPSAGPSRDIVGVDQSGLTAQQRQDIWDIAQQAFAPCEDQAVSLVQCVEEGRACATCKPALEFLTGEIKDGAARANARTALKLRFDREVVVDVEVGSSPTKGPANAPITIVAFSDFECPGCKAVIPVLEELQAKRPQEVRLVHKFFPLRQHTRARYAALAAWAAQQQGKYWEMEKLIFENQKELSDADLERYAASLSLDMVKWRAEDRKSVV